MLTDPSILDAAYQCFLEEAPGLLETIEQELFELSNDNTNIQGINSMMRAAHTIKGGAANVGLDTINKIAHYFEDVFRALASPDLEIDVETKTLLLEGYECLRLPLTAELTQAQIDDSEVLERATSVFARLNEKLGDYIDAAQDAIPTSEELGIDLVQTIFESIVPTHLDELADALDAEGVEAVLRAKTDIFIGFAESLGLPGLGEIANSILVALDAGATEAATVARVGLEDLQKARASILAGDRERGGEPSEALLTLATGMTAMAPAGEAAPTLDFGQQQLDVSAGEAFWGADSADFAAAPSMAAPPADGAKTDDGAEPLPDLANFFAGAEPTLEEPSAADSVPIAAAPEADPEETAAPPALDLQNNSLDNIWGSPVALNDAVSTAPTAASPDAVTIPSDFTFGPRDEATALPEAHPEPAALAFAGAPLVPDEPGAASPASGDSPQVDASDAAAIELFNSAWADLKDATPAAEASPSGQLVAEPAVAALPGIEGSASEKVVTEKPSSLERQPPQAKPAAKQTVRVDLEDLETLNYLIGDLLIEQNKNLLMEEDAKVTIGELEETLTRGKEALSQAMGQVELNATSDAFAVATGQKAAPRDGTAGATVGTKDIGKAFARLQEAMGEIVAAVETVQRVKSLAKESRLVLKRQQRTSLSMRDELLGSRMVTLENVLNRFPRMIQQLSSVHGKNVELQLRGGHILVDKAVEQKLYDPLLHLIRNAFDHGIETPDVRREGGKHEPAKIEVAAFHQGCQTIIEIRDNGRGIDPQKIANKAIQLELISAAAASQLTEAQILEFLFEPGFSTASKVSDLSGRGVGLDVVRSQVRTLKGSVAIDSTLSVGTTFTLSLPLTLNIAKLMLCEAGGTTYSLLPDTIEKILVPSPEELSFYEGQQVLRWESDTGVQSIPVRRLIDLVSYDGRAKRMPVAADEFPSQAITVLMLRRKEGFLGLAIDRVLGEQELVIRPLGSALTPPSYAYGCSILPDGKLGLVVDPTTLVAGKSKDFTDESTVSRKSSKFRRDSQQALMAATAPPAGDSFASEAASEHEVLIVDDSPNARLSLSMSLKKAGYRVQEAVDGVDAISKLKQLKNIGLILCDVDMPNMNGFEFLTAFHQDPEIGKIPVAMLTSHNSKKYRQLATQLGASAYFAKPYRDNEVLPQIKKLLTV